MPNKTIYVAEDDLPLFERAQSLSGDNLSSAVVRALRRYVEIEESRRRGMEEITVLVGAAGEHRRKRFIGVRLVRRMERRAKGQGTDIVSVYRTAGKRFAVHTRTLKMWDVSWGDPGIFDKNRTKEPNLVTRIFSQMGWDWEGFVTGETESSSDFTLEVFETLDEMKPHISEEVYRGVLQTLDAPPLEDLDI